MTMYVLCNNCDFEYDKDQVNECPKCSHTLATGVPLSFGAEGKPVVAQTRSGKDNVKTPLVKNQSIEAPSLGSKKARFARIAQDSANLVNFYGTVIQIAGFIAGAGVFIGLAGTLGELGGNAFVSILVSAAAGALVILSFAISGAVWRMAANYVLYKTSEGE